jgi:hypothetical protein
MRNSVEKSVPYMPATKVRALRLDASSIYQMLCALSNSISFKIYNEQEQEIITVSLANSYKADTIRSSFDLDRIVDLCSTRKLKIL